MFKSKQQQHKPAAPSFSTSIIGAGNTITGNIESDADIRIDGTVIGNVFSKAKILLGPGAVVEGNINCREADINGHVNGNILTQELLYLKGNATISGDIHTTKLSIEPTVSFNGQCHMGANIVELKPEMGIAVNE